MTNIKKLIANSSLFIPNKASKTQAKVEDIRKQNIKFIRNAFMKNFVHIDIRSKIKSYYKLKLVDEMINTIGHLADTI